MLHGIGTTGTKETTTCTQDTQHSLSTQHIPHLTPLHYQGIITSNSIYTAVSKHATQQNNVNTTTTDNVKKALVTIA